MTLVLVAAIGVLGGWFGRPAWERFVKSRSPLPSLAPFEHPDGDG